MLIFFWFLCFYDKRNWSTWLATAAKSSSWLINNFLLIRVKSCEGLWVRESHYYREYEIIWESFMFSVFFMCLLLFFPLISDNGYIHWDLFASCWLVLTMLLPPFRQGCEAFIFFLAICCLSLFFLLSVIKFREVVHSLCLLLAQHSSSKLSETFWQKPTKEK